MPWRTEISLKNNSTDDMLCVIPQGLIFENKQVGTRRQNVAASREYRLIIPGGSRLTVDIEVLCINRSFSSPNGLPGNVTLFRVDRPFTDQNELWRIMGAPVV